MRIRIVKTCRGLFGQLDAGQVLDVKQSYINTLPADCWQLVNPPIVDEPIEPVTELKEVRQEPESIIPPVEGSEEKLVSRIPRASQSSKGSRPISTKKGKK
jgi:hypothetical protein